MMAYPKDWDSSFTSSTTMGSGSNGDDDGDDEDVENAVESSPQRPTTAIKADNWTEDPEPKPAAETVAEATEKGRSFRDLVNQCGLRSICCFPAVLGLGIAMTTLGAYRIGQCPKEPKIPYLMMIYGCVLLLFILTKTVVQCCCLSSAVRQHCAGAHSGDDAGAPPDDDASAPAGASGRCGTAAFVCFFLFYVVLFSLNGGLCVTVLRAWRPDLEDAASPDHCEKLVYVFALSYLVFVLAVVVLTCALLCCCCSLVTCFFCTQIYKAKHRRKARLIPRPLTSKAADQQGQGQGHQREERGRTGSRRSSDDDDVRSVSSVVSSDKAETKVAAADDLVANPWMSNYSEDDEWKREAARRTDLRF